MTYSRRQLAHSMAALAATGIASTALLKGQPAYAASDAAEIDRDATAALHRLVHMDRRAATLAPKASGILIFPKVVKAGFIFGAQGGKGALRVDGRTRQYYTLASASFGLQAGVAWFSYVLFFMNRQALHYLDSSDGWSLGSDPNVAVIDTGVGASISSTTLAKQVIAFPFGQNGLMADISLQGSKISTYNPNA